MSREAEQLISGLPEELQVAPLVSSRAAAKLSGSREQNDALHFFFFIHYIH